MKNQHFSHSLIHLFSTLLLFVFSISLVNAQQAGTNRDQYIIHIKKSKAEIRIDGSLDETDWQIAESAKDFHRVLPIDTGYATTQTEVRLTYDDRNFYIGVYCYESMPGDNIVESLRRDFSFGSNDNFLSFIDTYNDKTNGFTFGASAGGAQWDGLQADGGYVSLDWDCKFESAVKHYADHWVIEMGIPFKSLQFKAGVDQWGINFSRLDLKQNEKSSWAPVPRQFQTANLGFCGTIQWDEPPPKPKTNLSLIPYVLGGFSKNYETKENTEFNGDAGIDAKISLTPSLNLDLTVNPDFSQVEVDEQVTNLDRFELFFPEKRRFFLENKDLFTGYGKDGLRPFFSRRIGLENPVIAGARLSGKIDEKTRIGLLNMQTGSEDDISSANFTVASLQRRVFSRSNIGAFFINKQLTQKEADRPEDAYSFNRVVGIDYNLASPDSRWVGKAFLHKSITPGDDDTGYAFSTSLEYKTQQFAAEWSYDLVGEDYLAETGFVRRSGYHRFSPAMGYKFYPKSDKVANHGPELMLDILLDPKGTMTDREIHGAYEVEFLNRSGLEVSVKDSYIKLLQDFDPTNSEGFILEAGTEYNWQEVEVEYVSDARKLFHYGFEVGYGGFFNGNRFTLEGAAKYRFQPYGSFTLTFAYNKLSFPSPFEDVDFFLVGPKIDITFTDKIFLTTFLQYNNQEDNINTNIRFQWRYKPVSDLFIVYTDNYFPEELNVKNRALVAKLSYWFN
ncbi:MAG: carbohydrate binding family 9 domain-containing protein [Bacteroidetes bacterium]|nr:carbohydrate binding family 9 domain-containing protein [Bacteroidota bacterium]